MSAGIYIECPDCSFLLWEGKAVTHNCSHSKTIDRLRSGLAKAEALLVEACGKLADDGPCECAADALGTCWWCRWHDRADPATRRYFAEKGDDRG